MARFHRLAVLLPFVLVLGCGAAAQSNAPAGQPTGRSLGGNSLTACVVSGEVPVKAESPALCGTLSVPEDRTKPAGRRVALRVAVVPAVAAVPRAEPLFALAGGPGNASTQFFAWFPSVYTAVHATRDIVLIDQRGTGASNPVTIAAAPDTTGMSRANADAALRSWVHDVLATTEADPSQYGSAQAADDIDDVRAALGYERIDLYGASYGGTLAQFYLRQHPDRVRAVILDGSTPVDMPVLERMAASSQAALDLLLARCAKDAGCDAAFPDLAAEWALLRAGLPAGIRTNVVNPDTGQPAVADLAQVGPPLHNALLTAAAAAQVPLALHLAAGGHWEQTGTLVPPVTSGGPTLLMAGEIFCSESWARSDAAEVERVGGSSYLVPAQVASARDRERLCRFLPKAVVPADDASAVRTELPVLWLTADGDPQDPPANLAAVASQQPNSRIVVRPAQEHVIGHLGCGPSVISAFLEAGSAASLDVACMATPEAIPWRLALP